MRSVYNRIAPTDTWENLRRPEGAHDGVNVGPAERLVCGIAGAALVAAGVLTRAVVAGRPRRQ